MEKSRVEKLSRIKEQNYAYSYSYDISGNLGDIRKRYEKDPPPNKKVKIRGKVKRISKQDDMFVIRLEDLEAKVEIWVRTAHQLEQGKEVVLEGILTRLDGRLFLDSATLSEGDCLNVLDVKKNTTLSQSQKRFL